MASDSRPPSLRDTYSVPSSSWNFQKSGVPSSSNAASAHQPPPISSAGTSSMSIENGPEKLKWGNSNGSASSFISSTNASFIGTPPSSYTGSSYASGSYPYGSSSYGGIGYSGGHPRLALKALLASAFLQYTMTAIAMPWEVGKVLLQVQWVPKKLGGELAIEYEVELELELEEEEENDELSDSSTDDSYFHDPTSPTRQSRQAPRARPLAHVRKTSLDISAAKARAGISPLIISYGPADGVWGMIRRIRLWRTEGWPSLWKGLLTSVTLSLLTSTIQPSISSFLRPAFPPESAIIPPYLLPLASHIITGLILSPLDTLRTLQIIHPRPSPSPFTHFSLLTSNENGGEKITLGTLYTHPTLLYPAILDNALRPLISLAMPRMIERLTGVRVGVNVWMYPLCEFVGGVIGLGLTIPIETIRRRLQAQIVVHGIPDANSTGNAKATSLSEDQRVPSCVHLSPRPYKGMLDCFWRILTEERSGPPPRPKARRPSMRSPRPSMTPRPSSSATPKQKKGKGRLSGGGNKRDVRGVFDAESSMGHRPRMLSEEMRMSERKTSGQHRPDQLGSTSASASASAGNIQGETTLGERVEQEYEKVKAEIETRGLEGWLENTGLGQLYRGFGMGVGALALVLVLGLITGEEPEGWAEL